MIVQDPVGATVLTLGDTEPVGGYLVTGYDEGGRTWRRITTSSPVVDGEFEVQAALGGRNLSLSVYIEGASWAEVSTRHEALLDAVEVSGWRLQVGSVVWVCRVADSESPMPPKGTNSTYRQVTLTIPATQRRGV